MSFDDHITVYGRIEVELDLAELSANGTMLDLMGLSSAIKEFLENLPMSGPEMKVLSVKPTTKMWELEAQINSRNPRPWIDPLDKELPQ